MRHTQDERAAVTLPPGFSAHTATIGIKDTTPDFAVVLGAATCTGAAVFTQSRFAGASVTLSRQHFQQGRGIRGFVAISKNANVATGAEGAANAEEILRTVAQMTGLAPEQLVIASTGVIGRQYPMPKIRVHLAGLMHDAFTADAGAVARAIMTTDTHPKLAHVTVGNATIVGIAKGVGMIEPNMATLLAFILTDAQVEQRVLDATFRAVVDETFNCLSIDTDTSTSDTALVLASGVAGPVEPTVFAAGLREVCTTLVRQIARDGEGATRLIEITVQGARDDRQAKRVAKAIVNSPLVKTAVHGQDPNWGRVVMAIGKCSEEMDIVPETTTVAFGEVQVYPGTSDPALLAAVAAVMGREEVPIRVDLGIGPGAARVWGCDLSEEYVTINADYTT